MKLLRPTYQRNGSCLWLKRLESGRFKTSPDVTDEAIVLTTQDDQSTKINGCLNEPRSARSITQ